MKHLAGVLPVMAVLIVSCSSAATSETVGLIEPEIRVRQLTGQMLPRVDVDTDISLQVDVFNRSSEVITLERLELRSTSTSDVEFGPSVRQLDVQIPPDGVETIDLWVEARLTNPRADTRSPLMVRGTAIFDSPVGNFRKVFVEPVIEYRTERGD